MHNCTIIFLFFFMPFLRLPFADKKIRISPYDYGRNVAIIATVCTMLQNFHTTIASPSPLWLLDEISSGPTFEPSSSVRPTMNPSSQPTKKPSEQPSRQPFGMPSMQPSMCPSAQPSNQPSRQPTRFPTSQPSSLPTSQPSRQPSRQPRSQPSVIPTTNPSNPSSQPSRRPTTQPTTQPSRQPTRLPSVQPSRQPSGQPSSQPSTLPSTRPSLQPSRQPSSQPSHIPTVQPTSSPSNPSSQPSCQPSMQPSSQPLSDPSAQPSGRPSQPSRQPSSNPSNLPTKEPSNQPSRQPTLSPSSPSSQPSCQPSSQPTSQPLMQPSQKPSKQPFSKPTSQPSMQPSTKPSVHPSQKPSKYPSAQPSELPSTQPSRQPSSQPSLQPLARPSREPSSCPSNFPTGLPSRQPSRQPTSSPSSPSSQPSTRPTYGPSSEPTGVPSSMPTQMPTIIPECPAGTRYEYVANVGFVCISCLPGTFSLKKSIECSLCPAGYFSLGNSSSCTLCALNSYNNKQGMETCQSCAKNYVTGIRGAISDNECVNPNINFLISGVALILSAIIVYMHFFSGRLYQIAFERKFRLTRKCEKIFKILSESSESLTYICNSISREMLSNNKKSLVNSIKIKVLKPTLLLTCSLIAVPFVTVCYIFQTLFRVAFQAMIIWKAYEVIFNHSLLQNIEIFVNYLDDCFYFVDWNLDLRFVNFMFFPIRYLINALANIRFDLLLSSVRVTCSGAQAPLRLLLFLLVVKAVVIAIHSDYQILWNSLIEPYMGNVRTTVLNRIYFVYSTRNVIVTLASFAISIGISQLPQPSNIIQYLLNLVNLPSFFSDQGVALSSSNCDNIYDKFPIDTLLAHFSTILVIIVLPPLLIILSEALFPSIKNIEYTGQLYSPIGNSNQNRIRSNNSIPYLESNESYCSKTIRTVSMFFSVDWLFFKAISFFGELIVMNQNKFYESEYKIPILNEKKFRTEIDVFSKNTPPSLKAISMIIENNRSSSMDLDGVLYLPWFDNCDCHNKRDAINQRKFEKEALADIQKNIVPSYWQIIVEIRDEIHILILDFVGPSEKCVYRWVSLMMSSVLCLLFPFQLLTEKGRFRWKKVARSFFFLVCITFGIWTEDIVKEIKLFDNYKSDKNAGTEDRNEASKFTLDKFDSIVSTEAGDASEASESHVPTSISYIDNDPQLQFSQYVSSLVVPRVLLLQLFPYFTLILVATSVSSCPMFVFCKEMNEKLTPYFYIENLMQIATDLAKKDFGDQTKTSINRGYAYVIALYLSLKKIRVVNFFTNFLIAYISVAINFKPEHLRLLAPIFVLVLLAQGIIYGLYSILLIIKLIYPSLNNNRGKPLGVGVGGVVVVVGGDDSDVGDASEDDESEKESDSDEKSEEEEESDSNLGARRSGFNIGHAV